MDKQNVQTISYTEGPRRLLRRSIRLDVAPAYKVQARTLDVSASGLTIMSPRQFRKGIVCDIVFDLPHDGEHKIIQATSRTGDCVCVGIEGFRTNLQFVKLDDASRALIKNWMCCQT